MSKINLTKHTPGPWIVKQPGEHGKGLRVVHPIGITMDNGKEVFGGVADILTTRTSANNMSDVTEQANAELIASAPTLLAQNARLRAALERVVLAWSEQPLMLTHDDGERLRAMNKAIIPAKEVNGNW